MSGGGSDLEAEALAARFEEHRRHLEHVAYAVTGSMAAAEDCVQEAWLRLQRVDADEIRDLRAWLTTTVGHLALDQLGSAQARRERYVGTWLPEPVVEPIVPPPSTGALGDPVDRVTLDESLSLALLVVLERLSPAQRVAYLLHDVFGMPFDEVADVVGRSPAAVRQLASRARRDVRRHQPRAHATDAEQREVVEAFVAACAGGDLGALVSVLDPQVLLRSDGGGKVSSLRGVQQGSEQVARVLLGFLRKPPLEMRPVLVNGSFGVLARDWAGVLSVVSFVVSDGRVVVIDIVRNPDKLDGVDEA
ncbi:sigma-70 family RNA polymerase sigma factor [Mumia zhuanghuii]|uniref:RNA polymerase sigma factor SigJ n=2 Tax=Mumia TaxID=1546255 RepID=A0ABW1QIM5_9ACTN|nr:MULTISPECIES: RNA polymerase sigma factor SigJ [Mumia]KAA1424711.1 sigma-70 family RNA polymerase sigma factor [Mumia zhuanghuii]